MTQTTFDNRDAEHSKYAAMHWIHHNHHPRLTAEENSKGRFLVLDAPGYTDSNTARIPSAMLTELTKRGWIVIRTHPFDSRAYKVTRKGQRAAREQGFTFEHYRR